MLVQSIIDAIEVEYTKFLVHIGHEDHPSIRLSYMMMLLESAQKDPLETTKDQREMENYFEDNITRCMTALEEIIIP